MIIPVPQIRTRPGKHLCVNGSGQEDRISTDHLIHLLPQPPASVLFSTPGLRVINLNPATER